MSAVARKGKDRLRQRLSSHRGDRKLVFSQEHLFFYLSGNVIYAKREDFGCIPRFPAIKRSTRA